MKKEIHPKYQDTTFICSCGQKFNVKSSIGGEVRIEVCSQCHPFYTGKQKLVDTAGRVDKFKRRVELAAQKKAKK